MGDRKVYLDYYCDNCKLGLKVILLEDKIVCPCCKKVVYNKVKK